MSKRSVAIRIGALALIVGTMVLAFLWRERSWRERDRRRVEQIGRLHESRQRLCTIAQSRLLLAERHVRQDSLENHEALIEASFFEVSTYAPMCIELSPSLRDKVARFVRGLRRDELASGVLDLAAALEAGRQRNWEPIPQPSP